MDETLELSIEGCVGVGQADQSGDGEVFQADGRALAKAGGVWGTWKMCQ